MGAREDVLELWPELEWIEDETLREKVTQVWVHALEQSPLTAEDLRRIPFTLKAKDCPVTFMEHKRSVVHIAAAAAKAMTAFYGGKLPIDMDLLVAGAILIDVGKLLEYEVVEGEAVTSERGRLVRHTFSGVALAARFDIPDEVLHIIGTHSKEGDLGKRTVESLIVHHADFMSFEPFLA